MELVNEMASKVWTKRVGMLGLGVCAALALAAGRAGEVNAPDDEETIKGSFSQPLGEASESETASSSRSVMTTVDGGDTFTVTNENGKVTVQRNGEKLSKSQYRQKGGKIEILDGDGNVVKSLPAVPNVPKVPNVRGLRNLAMIAPSAPAAPAAPGSPRIIVKGAPRVMLGVTMTDADSEGDQEGAMLMSVTEGLPAAQAGLQAKDIVVEADGKPIEGEEALRAILKTKNPGDELALKILRKGESQTIRVKLAEFDAGKLQTRVTVTRSTDDESFDSEELVEILKGVEAQVKAQVEALRAQLNATDWNQVRDQVNAGLGEALKQLEEARVQAAEAGNLGAKWWQEHGQNFTMPKGWVQFSQPTPPPAPGAQSFPRHEMNAGVGDKLDRLSEQLEKMNKRLDAMEKQIEKK
ncbi:MAG: PDZ domain-containing protein [Phycisphaerales bacterium]|nr:PDZ domain-containing protein [Phycisphaerales bacterium]